MSSTPSTVERAFEVALYADSDAALDTGASLLAADPASDAELARRGEEFVAAVWRRGWQPADVVRIVRRELDDVHLQLVSELVRAEAGRDRRPRGPRWAAQLEELDARAPRTDRFSLATAALELYRLLLRLPTLEPLDAHLSDGTSRHPAAAQDSRMLTRIRALLAKAEATGFPEEAEALSAKAQELMARHSIDEALLAARTHAKDAPGACRIGVEPPYETAKAVLLDAVADTNRCRAVWNESLGFSTVVGFEPDLEAVELLYTSLLVQATAAMTKAEAAQRAGGRKRTKSFRQSFLAAYAHRIGDRLATAAEEAEGEATSQAPVAELLPVLAARDVAVNDHMERMFPDTVTTRLRGVNDAAGWQEGAAAADRAQVRARPPLR
ncbi:DUF2786 domain-containing protein [Streptomyces mirabilis]|uniref:DUF2786 domain-containing protein n=1 Tax=Streptomyces TaxID=1883 RepID=UPI0011624048|nr:MULTISPECIES: DUF2786 domain-containing protein [Streptomyces]MCX4610754.1 DUF2786 domain-containing protein [Streptomyces mirabilis]MCX5350970.1 DUF2786 domain-containing protein [Streptomyces mirabilis]QDN89253.1 DUF2786 domain-containing protein [Streptomyces sp. RLB3-6]QDO10101.1 DUF2786 domain-containing protein [Streptomyces sp. S1D4-23]